MRRAANPFSTAIQQYSLTPTASRKSTKTVKSTRLAIRRRTRRIQSKKDRVRNGLSVNTNIKLRESLLPGTKYKCVIFKYTMQVAIFLTLPSFHVCVVVVWWPVSSCLEEHGGRSLETPGSIKCVMMLFGCYLAAVFMLSLLCHCYVIVMSLLCCYTSVLMSI